MRVLVTGGLGFIGSNFIDHVLENHTEITAVLNIDRCDYCARVHNVSRCSDPRYTYVQADITNISKMKRLFHEFNPDTVVHFAAQSHVDTSFENAEQYIKDNIIGTYTVLECVKESCTSREATCLSSCATNTAERSESGCRLVHISTDEVYGEVDLDETSNSETSVLNPTNPYSATKAGAELLVKAYGHSFGIPYVITRGNNVFGPKQYPEKVIPAFIDAMMKGEPCKVHGEGRSRRNFIYVDDVSRAVMTVLQHGKNGTVYNIGSRNEYSVLEVFDILRQLVNSDATKVHVDDRPHNDKRYAVDSSALHELGWSEQVPFREAIRKTVDWYKANTSWYT
jgi:dTDP-glucose 4,6-dehydratase